MKKLLSLLLALSLLLSLSPAGAEGVPEPDWSQEDYRSVDVLDRVAGIDMVMDGHSHTVMTAGQHDAPASIRRVTIETVNGEPFDPEATYAVVTNSFCASGGDTYNVFENAGSGFDTGLLPEEAVTAYITEVLNGRITEDAYGEPRGTIIIR